MNRFKFRAWNIAGEVMVYFDKDDRYQLSHLFHLMNGTHGEDGIVEQCTGLKDKNGALIYEGDIVNVPYNYIGNAVVKFERGAYDITRYKLSELEVLGNIHENPELLELSQ